MTTPVPVSVIDVTQENDRDFVILLLHKEARRILGVWVGYAEMANISWLLAGRPWFWDGIRRPMTFDFIARLMRETGVFLREVEITNYDDHIYYAKVRLQAGHDEIELDARPSDAMALALTLNRPVYASLDAATVTSWPVDEIYEKGGPFGQSAKELIDNIKKYWQACTDSRVVANNAPVVALPETRDATLQKLVLLDILKKDEYTNVVILQHDESKRLLPIQISMWETWNLVWYAGGKPWPEEKPRRPFTFELCAQIFDAISLTPEGLLLQDFRDDIYLSSFAVAIGEKSQKIEVRPIDGIMLALQTSTPIYAPEWILAAAGESFSSRYPDPQRAGVSFKEMLHDLKVGYGVIPEEKPRGNWISRVFGRG